MSLFWKAIPIVNFTIASSALLFQVFHLAPWHNELDRSFGKLKKQRDSENTLALARLQTIESEMLDLNASFTELKSQRDAENRAVIGILKELKGSV